MDFSSHDDLLEEEEDFLMSGPLEKQRLYEPVDFFWLDLHEITMIMRHLHAVGKLGENGNGEKKRDFKFSS